MPDEALVKTLISTPIPLACKGSYWYVSSVPS